MKMERAPQSGTPPKCAASPSASLFCPSKLRPLPEFPAVSATRQVFRLGRQRAGPSSRGGSAVTRWAGTHTLTAAVPRGSFTRFPILPDSRRAAPGTLWHFVRSSIPYPCPCRKEKRHFSPPSRQEPRIAAGQTKPEKGVPPSPAWKRGMEIVLSRRSSSGTHSSSGKPRRRKANT